MIESKQELMTESESLPTGDYDWYSQYGIRHVALIPDGNRRWAKLHKLPAEIGHTNGLLKVMPDLVNKLCEAGVHTVTVWGFSTENWSRDTAEVNHLMKIGAEFLRRHLIGIAQRHDARIHHLGRKDRLFPEVREALVDAELATAKNRSHVYNIALDYGGRDELTRAAERLAIASRAPVSDKVLSISDFLDTSGQPHPEPDLVVRSSGEYRMSGFLPLQTVYSELFFVEEMFPDLTFDALRRVAEQFRWRKRRFGG
jgi:undecaprenyl diphosphate synthase